MPDIQLQDYMAKIKELIRSARLDEAIAHCQHILRQYPKHFETYCLLGEACLENQMYREAIEFFQRTLGVDPENLMARVGLGVIYDEQGAIPEAIWQLERAFELVPGNSEVRRELLRLYSQSAAGGKTRLNLTRGALGRLYSRNGLYDRAISEFRAVLRQDPELPDIRVALVEALWREGRQVEAVEMCLDLLDSLPNCLKANLILVDIWMHGGNEESAEQRLEVARALDPENRVAQDLMGKDSPLPPERVLVPELESMPDTLGFAPEGVLVAGAIGARDALDTIAAVVPDAETQEPWGADEELPDWLRDVGVTAEVEPALEVLGEEGDLAPPPDEALPTEEMPEWLQEVMGEEGIAPAGAPASVKAPVDEVFFLEEELDEPSPEPPEEAIEARLTAEAMAGGLLEEVEQEPPTPEMPAEEMPEWLQSLLGEAESAAGESPASLSEQVAAPPVAEIEEEIRPIEEEAPSAPEIPDWLRDLDTAEVEEIAAPPLAEIEEEIPSLEGEAEPAPEIPDWLRNLDTAEVEEIAALPLAEIEEEMPTLEEEVLLEDEIPDWLRDLGVVDVGEVTEIETEVIPVPLAVEVEEQDLIEPPVAEIQEEIPTLEEEVLLEDEIPDWLRDLDTADAKIAEIDTDALSALPVTEIEEERQVIAEEVPLIDEIPDWLRDLDKAEEEMPSAPVVEAQGTEIPASLRALVAAGLLDEADLESALAEMSEEEIAAQRAEEVPAWLSELIEEEPPKITEAELGPSEPVLQEISTPVTEIPLAEALVEEAVLKMEEPEPEVRLEEAVAEAEELVPEPTVEESVLKMEEPEPEVRLEEVVPEAEELVPEPTVEEVVLEVEELVPEPSVEEVMLEVEELVPEPSVEEVVLEVEEPEPEVRLEEAVAEAEELVPEPTVEESVLKMEEPEPEVRLEEVVPEAEELVPEPTVEEVVLEVEEPEPEPTVEEVVLEVKAPELEPATQEVVQEIEEPEPEPLVEETILKAEEPEIVVEEVVGEIEQPEPEPLIERAVLEVEKPEIDIPSRGDELLSQLKTRPRDYGARLELARLRYDEKDWSAALASYEKLISARRFLPEVIDDLEALLDQQVEQARVYHMLGDAYMQQDLLDEALEMYRLARQKLAKR